MKKNLMFACMTTAAALAIPSFVGAADPTPASAQGTATQSPSARPGDESTMQPAAASLNSRGTMSEKEFDSHFVSDVIQDNSAEIQLAKIAEQKTQDPQIKQVAQQMVEDHQKADTQLRQIAQAEGIAVPGQLNEVGTSKVALAERLSGPDFDRHFVFGMIGEHKMDILMFTSATRLLQDPQLKQFTEQTLPVLKHHLHELERLAGDEDAMTAGAHMTGSRSETGASGK